MGQSCDGRASLSAYVKQVVDAAPPLTPEQRDRIGAALARYRRIEPVGGSTLDRMLGVQPK